MATTKTRTLVWDNVTLTAGAADTVSGIQDWSDGYGGIVLLRLTNGATGPTIAAQVQIECAAVNTPHADDWYDDGGPLPGKTGNDEVQEFAPIDIPMGVKHLRFTAGSNTGQNVTVRLEIVEVEAV